MKIFLGVGGWLGSFQFKSIKSRRDKQQKIYVYIHTYIYVANLSGKSPKNRCLKGQAQISNKKRPPTKLGRLLNPKSVENNKLGGVWFLKWVGQWCMNSFFLSFTVNPHRDQRLKAFTDEVKSI